MLMRRLWDGDPRRLTGAGMLMLSAGLLLGRFGPRLLAPGLRIGFWAGLLDGISLAFVLVSIPFNVRGMLAARSGRGS